MKTGDMLKRIPTCNHHFHAKCVDEWLHVNKTCPLCVRDVEDEMKKQESQQQNQSSSPDVETSRLKFWKRKNRGSSVSQPETSG